MKSQTLTILLCQTRESNFTFPSLKENVLKPLSSDLAFCGSVQGDVADELLQAKAQFWWSMDEPTDWGASLDALHANSGKWRALADLGPLFLGGGDVPGTKGSGAIIMYWRAMLRDRITPEILDAYEWFVITRSDFLWEVPHPRVSILDPECIYLLDGERYGGVSDRHIIFHRMQAANILRIASPIFEEPEALRERLRAIRTPDLNPEKYIYFRLKEMGLEDRLRFLPYTGYTIRHHETSTRWSRGVRVKDLDFFIKYREEYVQTRITSRFITRDIHWRSFLGSEPDARQLSYRLFQRARSQAILAKGWVINMRGRLRRSGGKRKPADAKLPHAGM